MILTRGILTPVRHDVGSRKTPILDGPLERSNVQKPYKMELPSSEEEHLLICEKMAASFYFSQNGRNSSRFFV